jgi:Protein of unknown function (DUF1573)
MSSTERATKANRILHPENIVYGFVLVAPLIATLAYSTAMYGSPRQFLLVLRNEPLHVNLSSTALGAIESEEARDIDLNVENLSRTSYKILGVQLACDCMALTTPPPFVLGPRSCSGVKIAFHAPKETGRFERMLTLHTDNPNQRAIEVTVTGNVVQHGVSASSSR